MLVPVRAVHNRTICVLEDVTGSNVGANGYVGSVSIVAPTMLSSENEPQPFWLCALTLTWINLSTASPVSDTIEDIETVQVCVVAIVPVPSHPAKSPYVPSDFKNEIS